MDCPVPPCAVPLPRISSWGENTVCTSGGDPDRKGIACGKGYEVKDALHSVCVYLNVHEYPEGVMWSRLPMLLITNSWRAVASTNQMAVTSGGRREDDRTWIKSATSDWLCCISENKIWTLSVVKYIQCYLSWSSSLVPCHVKVLRFLWGRWGANWSRNADWNALFFCSTVIKCQMFSNDG